MRSEEAKVVAEFLLSTLENEIQTTTHVLAAVPGSKLDYCPHARSKTALGLVRHVTLEDEWLLNAVADGRLGPVPDDSDSCGLMSPGDAASCYKDRVTSALARVRAMSGEQLLRPVEFFGNPVPAIQILSMMLRHSVHHRGQLSTYLRPMGGRVPSIYGPSADTESAQA